MKLALVVVALSACADVDVSSVEQHAARPPCDESFCGHNSPTIAAYGTYHFKLDGTPNEEGFSVLALVHGTDVFDLKVENSQIHGYQNGTLKLFGTALDGAEIILENGGQQFGVTISDVGTTDEMAVSPGRLETYRLDWQAVAKFPLPGHIPGGTLLKNAPELEATPNAVCPAPVEVRPWDESSHMDRYDSIVFEGDVIHADDRTVDPYPDDNWFNVGCSTHLLTKLRLTRHTLHTGAKAKTEQAVIKMLSAQYCGLSAWTKDGQPLVWQSKNGKSSMAYFDAPVSLEARWDWTGALCLDEPRVGFAGDPGIAAKIAAECPKLSRCKDHDPYLMTSGEIVTSANHY